MLRVLIIIIITYYYTYVVRWFSCKTSSSDVDLCVHVVLRFLVYFRFRTVASLHRVEVSVTVGLLTNFD